MDPVLYWNEVALEANKVTQTVAGGEQGGPVLASRALAIAHLAMHDAYFGVHPAPAGQHGLYLQAIAGSLPPPGGNADAAIAAAACGTLAALYPSQRPAFEEARARAMVGTEGAGLSEQYGNAVAKAVLARLSLKPGEPAASDRAYSPSGARGHHREDPDNPAQGFYGTSYGATATRVAVTRPHQLDAPPLPAEQGADPAAYRAALDEVRRKGGAPTLKSTDRTPAETLIGMFWAYDGAARIGTPPRLYNKIVRQIATARNNDVAANARLFALVNAAMADAGIFAWREKYCRDLWRPVLGIREHDLAMGPSPTPGHALRTLCDPFWLPLGAPRTNIPGPAGKSFTPNFPSYPSGHATFGAAAFQSVRRFYGFAGQTADNLAFDIVSDELDGISTDMNGTVRPRHLRHFDSLWQAIFENGLSRVFLGVHWLFDAFAAEDVKNADGSYRNAETVVYRQNVGGVPLGLAIADDVFEGGLVWGTQPPPDVMA